MAEADQSYVIPEGFEIIKKNVNRGYAENINYSKYLFVGESKISIPNAYSAGYYEIYTSKRKHILFIPTDNMRRGYKFTMDARNGYRISVTLPHGLKALRMPKGFYKPSGKNMFTFYKEKR